MSHALQCPRCNGAVSIADESAGQRVKCPHCDQTFLAPGLSSTTDDDDDWLTLDQAPLTHPPATQPPASKPAGGQAPPPTRELSPNDEMWLAEFAGETDDFTAGTDTPPPPSAKSASPPPGPSAPTAVPVAYASEYRVTCLNCGSSHDVKATQAGKTITCGDCHSPVRVPPPPRLRPKVQINLDEAETFTFEQSELKARRPDPYRTSAEKYLADAAREEAAKEDPGDDDTPDIKEWIRDVFGVLFDLGVLVHWIGLSLLAAIPAFIALKLESAILVMGLFPGGVIFGALVVSCGFAILQSVANQEEGISEWPVLDPMGWLAQSFMALAAAAVAVIPVWVVCLLIMGPSLISLAITMFSVFTLFPFVLLSMLDMESPFVPFSAEVARSVTKCQESWGGFYFSSGLLFFCLFLVFVTASIISPPAGAALAIIAGVGVSFTYFAMIGRLAFAIGQAVNAPPMENTIDRSRQSDAT